MIDSVQRVHDLPKSGMHVAKTRAIFLRTWSSVAKSMLRYDNIQPGDWIEVQVTVTRTVSSKATKAEHRAEWKARQTKLKRGAR